MAGAACCTLPKCCCCCIELRTGALIVSSINLLVSSCLFSFWVWMGYQMKVSLEFLKNDDEEHTEIQFLYATAFFWITVITGVVTALAVVLDIMLLAGVINARRRLLLAWMVGYGIVYCTYALLMVLFILLMVVSFSQAVISQAVTIAIFIIIQTAVVIYFWVVVRSYHVELGYQYGDVARSTAGRVYNTVSMGDVPPAHGTHCYGGDGYNYDGGSYNYTGSVPRPPAKPPQYFSSEQGQ